MAGPQTLKITGTFSQFHELRQLIQDKLLSGTIQSDQQRRDLEAIHDEIRDQIEGEGDEDGI